MGSDIVCYLEFMKEGISLGIHVLLHE